MAVENRPDAPDTSAGHVPLATQSLNKKAPEKSGAWEVKIFSAPAANEIENSQT
jgi:hypothetical protein